MGSNFVASDATIIPSINCISDSSVGYSADFSSNGEVDGWEYYDGIHTYGAWGGFLFGTMYTNNGTIGRFEVFKSINATTHYTVRIAMKYNPAERGVRPLPTQGKIRWVSLQNTNWDDTKEIFFDLETDNEWHTYILNVGVAQWWQGDINNLRVYPAVDYAEDGDEFFIRSIDIFSIEAHECRNTTCEKYSEYSHPCPWIGQRAVKESAVHESDTRFSIDDLAELVININGYGDEVVRIPEVLNGSGRETANVLAKAISSTNIGGYSEVQVEYTDQYTFKIYSGTITANSSIVITNNELSRYLKFYNHNGVYTQTSIAGEDPVDGYTPLSSFKIKTHQALGLLDNNARTALTFNPFQYSIEAGRRDWLTSSTGVMETSIGSNTGDTSSQPIRKYYVIQNAGKTIIDYNHPFNASGRVTKIYAGATADDPDYVKSKYEAGSNGTTPPGTRKGDELYGAKLMIVRPKRDGRVEVIHEWELEDRDADRGYNDALYSLTQENIELDVDIFVNKGDMIALYNINMYAGKSVTGHEVDCQYFQVSAELEIGDIVEPGRLYGDGSSGLLVYAHGRETQRRLFLDIDLGSRYNLDKIDVNAETKNQLLEYNIARCLDIEWRCDTFNLSHKTHHTRIDMPGDFWYVRANTYYGLDKLSDGIFNVPRGLACDSYTLTNDLSSASWTNPAGPGVVPVNPRYFWINGDEEWLAVWLHATYIHQKISVHEFDQDPIALYLHFPFEKDKQIYKSSMYFKEKFNFRSFALSVYRGNNYTIGDADDMHYDLIPEYTMITLDNIEFYEGSPTYDLVAAYLFNNPTTGRLIYHASSQKLYEWDPNYSQLIRDYSGTGGTFQESGYFTTQTFAPDNEAEWETARKTDWQTIEHQWEPITCKGFRIYCDFHKSTKMTELELYGVTQDVGSNLAGGIFMNYSDYEEIWWAAESVQTSSKTVEIHVGDSPRYLTLELLPVTETRYDDVIISVTTEDIHAGPKGCEYDYFVNEGKTFVSNQGQSIEVKNTYGHPYDLYIDIDPGTLIDEGLVFYSPLNNADSIENPQIGPDANFHKLDDYPLLNQDYNCAINCHVYGLVNLVDGLPAYYSTNNGLVWREWGTVHNNIPVGFQNTLGQARSVIRFPVDSANRYWKIHFPNSTLNIREMEVYYDDQELTPELYRDANLLVHRGPIGTKAPHLDNVSIVGSYYAIDDDFCLGMDIGYQGHIDKLVLYHDVLACDTLMIDEYVHLYMRGDNLYDNSYFEQPMTIHGDVYSDSSVEGTHFGKGSLHFDGASYLSCPHTEGFNLRQKYRSIDFFFKWEELPGGDAIFMGTGTHIKFNWTGGRLQVWRNGSRIINYAWTPSLDVWHSVQFCWGAGNTSPGQYTLWVDGVQRSNSSSGNSNFGTGTADVTVGSGMKGWISNLRWSNDVARCGSKATRAWNSPSWPLPVSTFPHKFAMDLYASYNNVHFGLYANLDMFAGNRETTYHHEETVYDGDYYNHFAIDLGAAYDLGIVRNYGAADAHPVSINVDVNYSADNTGDINEVTFSDPSSSITFHEDFSTGGGKWYDVQGTATYDEGYLKHTSDGERARTIAIVDYGYSWDLTFRITQRGRGTYNDQYFINPLYSDSLGASISLYLRTYSDTDNYLSISVEGAPAIRSYSYNWYDEAVLDSWINVRLKKDSGNNIYLRLWIEPDLEPAQWDVVTTCSVNFPIEAYFDINTVYTGNNGTGIDDIVLTIPQPSYDNARWVRFDLLASDNVSRTIQKIGVYPDVTNHLAPAGQLNCEWTALGPAITSFSTGDNVALGAAITSSSYMSVNLPENLVDGIINSEREDAWLSDNETDQWLLIDLGELKNIYRIKIFHGFDPDDDDYLVLDYTISSSLDNVLFTDRWDIVNNSSYERTHDLAEPFSARYIKIDITDYRATTSIEIKEPDLINFYNWHGACMREIEIYDYYGYQYISSDQWPVIAIDLRDQFYIAGHALIGVDAESSVTDWDNDDSNFAWSDSVWSDPEKISFRDFGSTPFYEQWLVIQGPYSENTDYFLKHALIRTSTKENFVEYPWWFTSTISTLSRDYGQAVAVSNSSLKISYPESTVLDNVQFIEGSNWGVDSDIAFRDGVSFRWYIEDIDKLDTSEGYIYFGGLDGTVSPQPVEYRWSLATLSGGLMTGWNAPYLRLKEADEVIYNENADPRSLIQPEIPEYTQWQTFGMKFKGIGEAFDMNIDGMLIQRNRFMDASRFNYGLYLEGSDYMDCPLSGIDLRAGTIEFWFRPDYIFSGQDIYNRYKNRAFFHIGNVAGDVLGLVFNTYGMNLYYGNVARDLRTFLISDSFTGEIDALYHMAVVFSANGQNINLPGATMQIYLNGGLLGSNFDPWTYSDEKLFKFTLGGKPPLAVVETAASYQNTSVDSVVSNLRIYNYCKSNFDDSMTNSFSDGSGDLLLPSKMIEISQDNVTYYKVGAAELPFFYEKVPVDDTITIYTRANIPYRLTGAEKRTAGIITSWDIGV